MASHYRTRRPTSYAAGSLSAFSERLFGHLPRADQRRWAHAYLEGLLTTPGKKSVRRLAATVSESPTAPQSLQQFISASGWDWGPTRRELAHWSEQRLPARAWCLGMAAFPKRGERSVGVHRHFVPQDGRVINCQLGTGLFLASPVNSVAVDWRLRLTEQWTGDTRMRERARIPEPVQQRPLWADLLDLVDTQTSRASHTRLPVVTDFSGMSETPELVRELGKRDHGFVITVPPHLRVRASSPGPLGVHEPVSAQEFLDGPRIQQTHPATVTGSDGQQRYVRIVSGLVQMPGERPGAPAPRRIYRLFTQQRPRWHPQGQGPMWLTNLVHRDMGEILALAALEKGVAATLESLETDLGLLDFEGRSFPGWHHHMTLVSAAHAYRALAPHDTGAGMWGRHSA